MRRFGSRAEAAAARIVVEALSRFHLGATEERGLVVGYGRLHKSVVMEAMKALGCIVRRHR